MYALRSKGAGALAVVELLSIIIEQRIEDRLLVDALH